jgi:peptide/nickel transport system permease protein
MRTATLDVINQDFVRTARAKGLTPCRMLMKHVVGNARLMKWTDRQRFLDT